MFSRKKVLTAYQKDIVFGYINNIEKTHSDLRICIVIKQICLLYCQPYEEIILHSPNLQTNALKNKADTGINDFPGFEVLYGRQIDLKHYMLQYSSGVYVFQEIFLTLVLD